MVEVTQRVDGGEQVGAVTVALEPQRVDHPRRVLAQLAVLGREQAEVPVISLWATVSWSERALQPVKAEFLAQPLADLGVRDGCVKQHVEHVVEQSAAVFFVAGTGGEEIGELVAGTAVGPGYRLVEQLHKLVEHVDMGLGERCRQHGGATFGHQPSQSPGATAPADVGEMSATPRRQTNLSERPVEPIRAEIADEGELVRLRADHFGARRGRTLPEPHQATGSHVRIDTQQPVECRSCRLVE